MTDYAWTINRRTFLASLTAMALMPAGKGLAAQMRAKPIPATGELLPCIGMGSWMTFNVSDGTGLRDLRIEVLRAFFNAGGGMVDSSPMYGDSEEVIGYCLGKLPDVSTLFSATKVWTPMQWHGKRQIDTSEQLWGGKRFDLLQIHNLLNWESHLETLLQYKADGRVRYIGVTTSHGRRHDELEHIMKTQPIDFIQLTYNMIDREAEQRLLPLAREKGLAVICNRPFQRGGLFDQFQSHPLPTWAAEIECANWAQFFLKFIVSHDAVSCAIPATSRVDHMRENMGAGLGILPDDAMRNRMIGYIEGL